MFRSSQCSLSFRLSHQNPISISPVLPILCSLTWSFEIYLRRSTSYSRRMTANCITRFRNMPKSEVHNTQLSKIQEQMNRVNMETSYNN
jgi:hypothetical protein